MQLGLVKVQQWIGLINEIMNVNQRNEINVTFLPKKWQIKSLVCQQYHHQKVFIG